MRADHTSGVVGLCTAAHQVNTSSPPSWPLPGPTAPSQSPFLGDSPRRLPGWLRQARGPFSRGLYEHLHKRHVRKTGGGGELEQRRGRDLLREADVDKCRTAAFRAAALLETDGHLETSPAERCVQSTKTPNPRTELRTAEIQRMRSIFMTNLQRFTLRFPVSSSYRECAGESVLTSVRG